MCEIPKFCLGTREVHRFRFLSYELHAWPHWDAAGQDVDRNASQGVDRKAIQGVDRNAMTTGYVTGYVSPFARGGRLPGEFSTSL